MPYFDRFDICEAYAVLEWDWNTSGVLWERPSNERRREATDMQLRRIRFKPRPNLSFRTLTENGREIYYAACERFGLAMGHCERCDGKAVAHFGEDREEMLCGPCYEVVSREIDPATGECIRKD